MFKKLGNMFKKKEECVQLPERPSCPMCRLVKTSGRSGEKDAYFSDKSSAKVEIINESNVPGRGVYTINICNSEKVGWCDAPIFYCPYCGKRLGEE